MKREVTCGPCGARWLALVGKYPGEHVKIVEGTARRAFVCDGCGCPLPQSSAVSAVSIYTERTPYSPWEHDYLEASDA